MNRSRAVIFLMTVAVFSGCGPQARPPDGKVVLTVNDYQVTRQEFDEGFDASAFAERSDVAQARADYLENLINQKLIVLEAQKKKLDRTQDFLRSVERFWEQSLMTISLGVKTREISNSLDIREYELRRFYDNMVKEGITTKSYQDVYPQIKWQAQKQMESRLLSEWMKDLRSKAKVSYDKELLKAE